MQLHIKQQAVCAVLRCSSLLIIYAAKINSVHPIRNRYVACLHNINIKPVDSTGFLSAGCLYLRGLKPAFRVYRFFSSCVPPNPRVPRKGCEGFRETIMHNGGSALLAVLILFVRIEIGVATFDTNHSVADSTQTIAAPIQKFPDCSKASQHSSP